MCCFTAAAPPADVSESDITTDSTSTIVHDTTTIMSDARQNEVDANFPKIDDKTTTLSDVDEKIGSIEADDEERSTQGENVSSTEQSAKLPLDKSTTKVLEITASTEQHTTVSQMPREEEVEAEEEDEYVEDVEEIEEPKSKAESERFATEAVEKVPPSTTTKIVPNDSTTSKIAHKVAVVPMPAIEESTNKSATDNVERTKALHKIRNVLRAHILRTILTVLNSEAKQRQKSQTEEMHAQESQVVEEKLYGSGYDVSSGGDDKVIAFDSNLQRYVYMDKGHYETMTSHNQRPDYVRL